MDSQERLPQICRRYSLQSVYLFGSRADEGLRLLAGEAVARDGSDLDVRSQIDLKVVWERLDHLRELLADLKRLPVASFEEFAAPWWTYPTAESPVRRSIDSLFDVARHILSRHFGMGALEYREVAVAMAEKDLVHDEPHLHRPPDRLSLHQVDLLDLDRRDPDAPRIALGIDDLP